MSRLRSGFRVSHPLAGFLLPGPSGLVPSRWHSWASPFRGFPSRGAAPPSRRSLPSWLSPPRRPPAGPRSRRVAASRRHIRKRGVETLAAFRALLPSRVRSRSGHRQASGSADPLLGFLSFRVSHLARVPLSRRSSRACLDVPPTGEPVSRASGCAPEVLTHAKLVDPSRVRPPLLEFRASASLDDWEARRLGLSFHLGSRRRVAATPPDPP